MSAHHPIGIDDTRRRLSLAAVLLAASPFIKFPGTPGAGAAGGNPARSIEGSTSDDGFRANKRVRAGELLVHYADVGPSNGRAVLLLHGWPYDIQTYADASLRLANAGLRVIVPYLRGFGSTQFLSARTPRNGQQSVLARDAIALLDALGIQQAVIGGCDWGARTANIVAALRPERVAGLVSVSGYLIGSQAAGEKPLMPEAELAWWYQFYFSTKRGRDGYESNRKEFARLIWRLASPKWDFTDEIFDRSARSLENADHVPVVIENYRWRLGLSRGDPALDGIEAALARMPGISVPTITLEGDSNGAPHPPSGSYRGKFTGVYEHREIAGGVGHNLPQEAPAAFTAAVLDVLAMAGPSSGR